MYHLCSENNGTAQLICIFVFAYAKIRFSHDRSHMCVCLQCLKALCVSTYIEPQFYCFQTLLDATTTPSSVSFAQNLIQGDLAQQMFAYEFEFINHMSYFTD